MNLAESLTITPSLSWLDYACMQYDLHNYRLNKCHCKEGNGRGAYFDVVDWFEGTMKTSDKQSFILFYGGSCSIVHRDISTLATGYIN